MEQLEKGGAGPESALPSSSHMGTMRISKVKNYTPAEI